jgi:hypothetical protein
MLIVGRINWWIMLRAAMLIAAVALLSIPQFSRAQIVSSADVHAFGSEHSERQSASDLLHEVEGHCHSGLECLMQAVFHARNDAQIRALDLRLTFQTGGPSLASQFVPLDPPPPRILT